MKVRGTALHVAEKYVQLARDAHSSGDRVQAENYLQHAEHYYRIVTAAQAQMPQPQPVYRNDGEGGEGEDDEERGQMGPGDRQQPYQQFRDQPSFGGPDPQPYVNGNGQERRDEQGAGEDGEDGQPEPQQPEANFRPEGEPRDNRRDQGGGAGFRPRRRRPYRERNGDRGGEPQGSPPPEGTGAGNDE